MIFLAMPELPNGKNSRSVKYNPANIYLFKVITETLEKGVRYLQD